MDFQTEADIENHQYVITYHNITRNVSFFNEISESLLNEMKQEHRDNLLKTILKSNE